MSILGNIRTKLTGAKALTTTLSNKKNEFLITYRGKNSVTEDFKTIDVIKKSIKRGRNTSDGLVDHPFDYEQIFELCRTFGPVRASVDKYHDFMLGPGFKVVTGDERADKLLEDFNRDMGMYDLFSRTIKGGLPAGTTVVEISTDTTTEIPNGFKIIPAPTAFIKKDEKGKITGVDQIIGDKDPIPLATKDVAIFTFNKLANSVYGDGIVYPVMHIINDILGSNKSLHKILKRKANTPIVATLGDEEHEAGAGDVTAFGKELEYLSDKTEFAVNHLVKLDTLDYGNVGEKFSFVIENDWKMFYASMQIPEILFGQGNVTQGTSDVDLDTFQRRIVSLQEEFEKPAEEQIYRRFLDAHGFKDLKPEFIWSLPSEMEKNNKLAKFKELLSVNLLSQSLRDAIEQEVAEILEVELIPTPEEEREEEEKEPTPRTPGSNENGRTLKNPPEGVETECVHSKHIHTENCTCEEQYDWEEELAKDYSIQEFVGFNYNDYLSDVLSEVERDEFVSLLAKTNIELEAGLLTTPQITKMKEIFDEGFRDGLSMKKMSDRIAKEINLKDRLVLDKEGNLKLNKKGKPILSTKAKFRAMAITRSEVVRLSNNGALTNYKKHDVKEVRWVSTISERTCAFCESMYNTILPINEAVSMIPAHSMCRCTWVGIVEGLS